MNDETKKKRIQQVARSLKDLHVVSSMEEALERAKQIISSTDQEGESISDLAEKEMQKKVKAAEEKQKVTEEHQKEVRENLDSSAEEIKAKIDSAIDSLKDDKDFLDDIDDEFEKDKHIHKLEKGDVKASKKELDVIEHAVDDVKEIAEEADKVQKKE